MSTGPLTECRESSELRRRRVRRWWAAFSALMGLLMTGTMMLPMSSCEMVYGDGGDWIPLEQVINFASANNLVWDTAASLQAGSRDLSAIWLMWLAPFGFSLLVVFAAARRFADPDSNEMLTSRLLFAYVVLCTAMLWWCSWNVYRIDLDWQWRVYFDFRHNRLVTNLILPALFLLWIWRGMRLREHAAIFITFWGSILCFIWAVRWLGPSEVPGVGLCGHIVVSMGLAICTLWEAFYLSSVRGDGGRLRVLLAMQPLSVGTCRKCAYDLTGNVSGRCPECGTAVRIE